MLKPNLDLAIVSRRRLFPSFFPSRFFLGGEEIGCWPHYCRIFCLNNLCNDFLFLFHFPFCWRHFIINYSMAAYPSLEVKSVIRRCSVPLHSVVAHIVAPAATATCSLFVVGAGAGRRWSALFADSSVAVFDEAAMMNCTSFVFCVIFQLKKKYKKKQKRLLLDSRVISGPPVACILPTHSSY